jgi:hypothetical protein
LAARKSGREVSEPIAVRHAACLCVARRQVVAQDVAVVPEFLDDGGVFIDLLITLSFALTA